MNRAWKYSIQRGMIPLSTRQMNMVATTKSKSEFVQKAERAFQRAVRKVFEERAAQNETVSIWRDGKMMILPAKDLLRELNENTEPSR
jgi:hypothetical protein